jgi:hypothetical protein
MLALIHQLNAAGISLELTEGRLRAFPASSITPDLRALIADQRDAIVNVLEAFEERAAILEFDAGFPRDEAEHVATRMLGLEPASPDGLQRTI